MEPDYVDISALVSDVRDYLYDAGFDRSLYVIDDFDSNRLYIEVYFIAIDAIDYILRDIGKSDYSGVLEIKKYRHKGGICSAVITYLY